MLKSKRLALLFWLLVAVGIALRVAAIHERPAGVLQVAPDEDEYYLIAQSVARGEGFALRGETTAYRDMLMPCTAGVLMMLFGESPLPMLYLNVILSVATALLIFELGRRRFKEEISVLLGGLWLLYPAAILFCALFFTETLFVFLWVLALVVHDRLEERNYRWSVALLLGAVTGLAILTRAVGIVLLLSFVIYIGLIRWEAPRRDRWLAIAVMLGGCAIIVQPWMTRNAIAVSGFMLNTNSGINLFIGNNARATGSYLFDEKHDRMLPPMEMGEVARDVAARELAWQFLSERTRQAVKLWGRKFAYLWSTDMSQWAHYYGPNLSGSLGEKLRSLPVGYLLVVGVPYALLVLFGVSGYYLVRYFPTRGIFLLQIFLVTMIVFLSFGAPRFHFPLMPLLLIGIGVLFRRIVWRLAPE